MQRKRTDPVHQGLRTIKSLPVPKLLDIKYDFYGFIGDLIETVTNEYINVIGCFSRVFASSIVMC